MVLLWFWYACVMVLIGRIPDLILLAIFENEEQHKTVQQESSSIGGDYGKVFFDDPIDDPKSEARDQHEEHSRRNIIDFLSFPGFQELGHYGGGRKDSSYEAKDTGPIQIVWVRG